MAARGRLRPQSAPRKSAPSICRPAAPCAAGSVLVLSSTPIRKSLDSRPPSVQYCFIQTVFRPWGGEERGRHTMSYTKEDIIRIVKEEDIEFIRMQFVDIFGQLKNVAITASQIEKAVNNQIMFDGSSIEGFVRIDESDQYLYPDLDTFCHLPLAAQPRQGGPADLRRVQPRRHPLCGRPPGRAQAGAPERPETWALTPSTSGPRRSSSCSRPTTRASPPPRPTTRRATSTWAPWTTARATRREICLALEQMGFEIEASHHEVRRRASMRSTSSTPTPCARADNIMTFKLAVKTLAQKQRPPRHLHAQAHLRRQRLRHAHQHVPVPGRKERLLRSQTASGSLSTEAYSFIAGLLAHVKGMAAVTNPLVNSYKRLVPGYEAPCYLAWSASNRSALIRIPAARGQSTRVELRCPDPVLQPLSGVGRLPGRRPGRHRAGPDPAP